MNIKIAINSQLLTTESKKQTKQTTRTETESQICRSFVGLSAGRRNGENGGKCSRIKKHNWQVQNRQGDAKNIQEMEKPKNLHARPMDMN